MQTFWCCFYPMALCMVSIQYRLVHTTRSFLTQNWFQTNSLLHARVFCVLFLFRFKTRARQHQQKQQSNLEIKAQKKRVKHFHSRLQQNKEQFCAKFLTIRANMNSIFSLIQTSDTPAFAFISIENITSICVLCAAFPNIFNSVLSLFFILIYRPCQFACMRVSNAFTWKLHHNQEHKNKHRTDFHFFI